MMQFPTNQESNMILDYVLLPIVLIVLQRDLEELKQSKIKLQEPYIKLFQMTMDTINKDLASIKAEFRRCGIKVYEDIHNQKGIGCKYLCRGYHHDLYMFWELAKVRVIVRVCQWSILNRHYWPHQTVSYSSKKTIEALLSFGNYLHEM